MVVVWKRRTYLSVDESQQVWVTVLQNAALHEKAEEIGTFAARGHDLCE